MGVALVGSAGQYEAGDKNQITVSYSAAASGNVLTLTLGILSAGGVTFTPPSGFTLVRDDDYTDGDDVRIITWAKESAGETSFQVTFSTMFVNRGTLVIAEWSGADVSDPTGDHDANTGWGANPIAPSVDTTVADSVHLTSFMIWAVTTHTLPNSTVYNQGAGDACLAIGYSVVASAGASGTQQATIDAQAYVAQSVVINADAGGGGDPEGKLVGGKLVGGGLLTSGVLV